LGLNEPQIFEKSLLGKHCLYGFEVEDKLFRIEQILEKIRNPPSYMLETANHA
jgi:hypothetical protein